MVRRSRLERRTSGAKTLIGSSVIWHGRTRALRSSTQSKTRGNLHSSRFIGPICFCLAKLSSKQPTSYIARSPLPWTGAPCSPERTWAEDDGAQPLPTLLLYSEETTSESKSPFTWSESIGRTRFRPMFPDFLHRGSCSHAHSRTPALTWQRCVLPALIAHKARPPAR